MYDLLALAYQADITRVATFMVAREESNKTYPQIGVHEGHHATSHHQNRPEKLEKLFKIQQYHVSLFGDFLKKLDSIQDGDGTLLDHSLILYGSNMSNSNAHNHFPLPNLVVGGATGRHAGRPSSQVPGPYADDEPDFEPARQGRRADGHAGRQHRRAGGRLTPATPAGIEIIPCSENRCA